MAHESFAEAHPLNGIINVSDPVVQAQRIDASPIGTFTGHPQKANFW